MSYCAALIGLLVATFAGRLSVIACYARGWSWSGSHADVNDLSRLRIAARVSSTTQPDLYQNDRYGMILPTPPFTL